MRSHMSFAFVAALLAAGCGHAEKTPIVAPGVAPVEDASSVAFPAAAGADLHPEALNVESSDGKGDETIKGRAHAKGFIHADLLHVWQAFQDPDTVADRRKLDHWTVDKNVETGFDVSFRLHATTKATLGASLGFDMTLRQSATLGTAAAPEQVNCYAQKTDGNSWIGPLLDSAVLIALDDGNTSIELVRHGNGEIYDEGDAKQYVQDLYDSVKAKAKGLALPTY